MSRPNIDKIGIDASDMFIPTSNEDRQKFIEEEQERLLNEPADVNNESVYDDEMDPIHKAAIIIGVFTLLALFTK